MALAERYNSDPCQFSVRPDVIRAMKGASKRYAERIAAEQVALKRLRTDKLSSSKPGTTEAQAQKEVADAERMLKNAELLIDCGMKLKIFSDMQSGQAVMTQAREKMAASMRQVEMVKNTDRKEMLVEISISVSI